MFTPNGSKFDRKSYEARIKAEEKAGTKMIVTLVLFAFALLALAAICQYV